MSFTVTLWTVLVMLLCAIPGYLLIKSKLVKDNFIKDLSKFLIYICQPCLMIYSFDQCDNNAETLISIGIGFAAVIIVQVLFITLFKFIYKNLFKDVRYRIATLATSFGNFGFLGLPVIQALLPNYPQAAVISGTFAVGMNIVAWILGPYIITNDKKSISVKKMILNPTTLVLLVIIPMFLTGSKLSGNAGSFSNQLGNIITIVGKSSTPICMVVLGMRLATVKLKSIFTDALVYVTCLIKLIICPLLGYGLVYFLPIAEYIKQTIFILFCTPIASIVLNFSEMVGEGQKMAANCVLLSTILSTLTIPLMVLIL